MKCYKYLMDSTFDVLAATCPTREVFGRLGERWTALIVLALLNGPLRFNALRRAVDGVTQKMLTQTLRAMERDGLVSRRVTPTVPVSVEYALTPLGRDLAGLIVELRNWSYEHMADITQARARYDAQPSSAPTGGASNTPINVPGQYI